MLTSVARVTTPPDRIVWYARRSIMSGSSTKPPERVIAEADATLVDRMPRNGTITTAQQTSRMTPLSARAPGDGGARPGVVERTLIGTNPTRLVTVRRARERPPTTSLGARRSR